MKNECSLEWTSVHVFIGVSHTDMRIRDVCLHADGTEQHSTVLQTAFISYESDRYFYKDRRKLNKILTTYCLEVFASQQFVMTLHKEHFHDLLIRRVEFL